MSNKVTSADENQQNFYVIGAAAGLVIGLLAAHFYKRAVEESQNENGISATDFVKLGLAIITLVRQITELGAGKKS